MSNRMIQDHARRVLVSKHELKRQRHKAIWQDLNLPTKLRYNSFMKLSQICRNSSSTRIKNRCVITGRARSVYAKMKISRIVFRELASKGEIMGISKSSW